MFFGRRCIQMILVHRLPAGWIGRFCMPIRLVRRSSLMAGVYDRQLKSNEIEGLQFDSTLFYRLWRQVWVGIVAWR